MSEPFLLETERLILRPFRETDLAALIAYRSDPDVARYQSWEAPYGREEAARFVEEMGRIIPGMPGDWYQVAIERRADDLLLGDCAFCVLPEDTRQAEIGFTLAKEHQGQGYASEAVSRLLDHLFGEFGLHRVRAVCDAENPRSARLLERVGMRREGCMVEATWFKGRWSAEYHYAILRREWTHRRIG